MKLINYSGILNEIKQIVQKARYNSFTAVNAEMLKAYFEIGRKIIEEEQKGKRRAGYGKHLLEAISSELIKEFGRGFSVTALKNMRIFYKAYKDKISQSVTDEFFKLTWTHYCELIKIKDKSKRQYFEKYTASENLSVRDLKRQIYSLHYERLLMSKDKKALIEYEKKELNKEGDNEPIGIILCTEKDKVQIEYATAGISNKLFVSKYKLYLPTKEGLEREIRGLL